MKPKTSSTTEVVLAREARARKNCFRVWTIIGSIILLVGLGFVLNVLSIPVGIIIWTMVIVFVLRTPVNWLEKHNVNRILGTAISYFGMIIVIAAAGLLLFSPVFGIGDQFTNLIQSIPEYVNQLSAWWSGFSGNYSDVLSNEPIATWVNDTSAALGNWASEVAKSSADGLFAVGSTIVNSFMVIGFSFVVAFWILMDLPAIGREVKRLISDSRQEDARMLYITFTRVMGGYIKATLVQCFLIGLGCGIAFQILGLPNAAALGGITGLLNIIPVVGPWLGGALAAIIGIFISPWVAILALVITVAIQQVIYTFVSPKLMANSVNIHPALVILALLAGSAIGGAMNGLMGSLVGMLASIPAVAAGKAIFVYYFERKVGHRIVSEDGVFFKGTPEDQEEESFDPTADSTEMTEDEITEAIEEIPYGKAQKTDDEASAKPHTGQTTQTDESKKDGHQ